MGYNAKNYTEQNGEKTVIGGEIVIDGKITKGSNAEVVGFLTTKAANQAASTASDVAGVVADLNALLTKLKTAGLMTADE